MKNRKAGQLNLVLAVDKASVYATEQKLVEASMVTVASLIQMPSSWEIFFHEQCVRALLVGATTYCSTSSYNVQSRAIKSLVHIIYIIMMPYTCIGVIHGSMNIIKICIVIVKN